MAGGAPNVLRSKGDNLEVVTMQAAAVKRVSILGMTLLLVLVPFGGYYLSYVSSQRDYYRSKNLRVLKAIASQIDSKIQGISESVQNAADKAVADRRDKPASKLEKNLCRALKLIPARAGVPLEYASGSFRDASGNGEKTLPKNASPQGKFLMSVRIDPDERVIYLTCSRQSEPAFSFEVKCRLSRYGSKDGLLDPIVEPYVFDDVFDGHQHLFEAIVVADQADGKIIFQRGKSQPTLTSLNGLISAADGKSIDTHQHTSTVYTIR